MNRSRAGGADLSLVASLFAAAAAAAAVATAGLVAWQVREEGRAARLSARVEILWRLNDQWNTPEMGDVRGAAAAALLSGKPSADVDAVLDFFDELALLMDRGSLDEEVAALYFHWPLANYWAAASEYVKRVRRDEPAAWEAVGGLADRLNAIEARHRRRPAASLAPSAGQIRQFLLDEQGDSECTGDSEVHKTPA